eukprot:TRINITY_DN10721_c0_g1_i1.p1 TRINITY_DN10721_c0_g1~~TRINITY_DN10721_c0_g1_i1.p1  ORF type:complete len:312 (+),score=30.33 TRINITY_DN10721_c0_g1_i1:96-1031(+)
MGDMLLNHWVHKPYDSIHFLLCGLYLLLTLISLAILIRLAAKKHLHLVWQKSFHPLLILGALVRAAYFGIAAYAIEGQLKISNRVDVILNTLPSFFFFSDYLILLFLWAEIYHNAYRKTSGTKPAMSRLTPSFVVLNVVMYLVLLCLYIADFVADSQVDLPVSFTSNNIETATFAYTGGVYLLTSVGFLIYGGRIYFKFSQMRMNTKARKKVLGKIQLITALVVSCFIARSIIVLIGTFKNLSLQWYFDLLYFFFLEIIPLIMMLYVLHGDSIKKQKRHKKYGDEQQRLIHASPSQSVYGGVGSGSSGPLN